ncbi:hypothetical protein A3863_07575 (plasmid) [Priestia endophytica]|nr:hypothetical protein A3863_07575 [Priestia endophytica]
MIEFFLAVFLTVTLHELGHIFFIIIFNYTEGRDLFNFKVEFNFKYFYVVNERYSNPIKNLIVSLSGSLFPVLLSILLINVMNSNFVNIVFLTSLFNLLFLHPRLPDGQNILNSLEEMRRTP